MLLAWDDFVRYSAAIIGGAILCLGLLAGGCGMELDKLYALPLDHEPTEADWARAVPIRFTAVGGATSLPGESDVDADSVHKATASCHHGGKTPPIKVEARAFYTPERLYLRFRWGDPTADLGPLWRWSGGRWRASSERQDGLGVLWGDGDPAFNCVRTCHLRDWRMAGKRAFADYAMETREGSSLDFWVWRAGRGTPAGAAEDAFLSPAGRIGDGQPAVASSGTLRSGGPGSFDRPNSLLWREGREGMFGETDAPLEAPVPEPGAVAVGQVLADSSPGRNEVAGSGVHDSGGWTVTLSRAFTGSDAGDGTFRPGLDYVFGLAVRDGVALDHNAVAVPVRLRLVTLEEMRRNGGNVGD